ncbi:MAG: hypothetical protein K0S41_2560 [Anaerocolumna sp.]|nr:hypothetical protein [Anaerocolumna sp.]
MMKAKLRFIKILSVISISIFLCFLLSKNSSILTKAEEQSSTILEKTITATNETMSITVDYGFDQFAKYGRYMEVTVNVENKQTDFQGWFEIVVPSASDNVAYRKEFKVNANQSAKISLTVPVIDDTGLLHVKIIDKKYNTIVEKDCKIKIGNYEKQLYFGVLSDKPNELEYMNTLGSRVFYLDENNLSDDYLGLDLLDVIVVNHFDTKRLSDAQLNAIKEWVLKGGTLVIGTGENVLDSLAKIGKTYDIEFNGEFSKDDITFGMDEVKLKEIKQLIKSYEDERKYLIENIKSRNEMLLTYGRSAIEIQDAIPDNWAQNTINNLKIIPVNKEIAKVKIKDGVSFIDENDTDIMQVLDYGQGKIQLFSIDLGFVDKYKSMGTAFFTEIAKNISQINLLKIQEEYYGASKGYTINSSITNSNDNNVPKTGKYVIIIIIYILLIGPISFFVLKKLDKRSLTWIVVPITAIVFTTIIYFVGADTRISNPFISYVEIFNFKDESNVDNEVYFSVTAPYNHDYIVDYKGNDNIKELKSSRYNYYMENLDSKNNYLLEQFSSAINYGINETTIEIKDNPAFNPLYYQSKNTITKDNKLTAQVSYTGEKISGTLNNQFDFDMTNSMLMSDGYIVNLGTIASGEMISLNDKEGVYLSTKDDIYNTNIINEIAGGTSDIADNTREINQKSNIINYFVEDKIMFGSYDSFVLGFIDDSPWNGMLTVQLPDRFISKLSKGIETFGIKVVVIPIDVNYNKGNETFVSSIDSFAVSDGIQNKYYSTRYLSGESTTIEYRLPAQDKVLSIEYLINRNQDSMNEYLVKFEGKIYFLNQITGNYDEVFKTGTGGSVTNVTDYFTDDNTITIRYSSDLSSNGYQMVLPHISYWKEAESNVKN